MKVTNSELSRKENILKMIGHFRCHVIFVNKFIFIIVYSYCQAPAELNDDGYFRNGWNVGNTRNVNMCE